MAAPDAPFDMQLIRIAFVDVDGLYQQLRGDGMEFPGVFQDVMAGPTPE